MFIWFPVLFSTGSNNLTRRNIAWQAFVFRYFFTTTKSLEISVHYPVHPEKRPLLASFILPLLIPKKRVFDRGMDFNLFSKHIFNKKSMQTRILKSPVCTLRSMFLYLFPQRKKTPMIQTTRIPTIPCTKVAMVCAR